jgi:hypothetical protein
VCNFLELYRQTGDEECKHLALRLVAQVHDTLGRHRRDDGRTGWISGLSEEEGGRHPTLGGLRIGKGMRERDPEEPYDENLEWDRDGQYYHYMAKSIHARFTYLPSSGSRKRMYWKMSIDLSRPLVPSMGQHDALDGYITYIQLQATAEKDTERATGQDLGPEIVDMARMCEGKTWTTDDPLGIGGLLCDACRAAQLGFDDPTDKHDLVVALLESSLQGLRYFARGNSLSSPVDYRLAFRELGLSIGLRALQRLQRLIETNPDLFGKTHQVHPAIESLIRYVPLGEKIETFWLRRPNRESRTWKEHREINMVMLATSLAPGGYLAL